LNPELTGIDSYPCATELIPWYVNGTLEAAAATRLGAHLKGCEACRREYEGQVRLFEAMQTDGNLVFAAEPSFQKLMTRIGTHEDAGALAIGVPPLAPTATAARATRAPWRPARWLAAAAVLEGLALGYGAWTWHDYSATAQAAYVTLTSPAPSYRDGPRLRVVFRSGLSIQSLGVMLHQARAHIIDGPTDSNVYTLGFTGSEVTPQVLEQRAAALRASSDVLFAEPLGADTNPR
jgi:Putative zinc-finger